MKKSTFICAAFAAIVLVAGCNKQSTADFPDFQQEIGLRPVGGMSTKSVINGTAFPQGYDMIVSAYRNLGSNPGGDSAQDYFEGIQFGYDGVSGSWKSEKGSKYYPLDGTLDFLAIAGAGINASSTGIVPTVTWGESSNVAKKFVAAVPDNSGKFDDILYGASNGQGISASGSAMVFNHAMTSVVFVAKCNVAYNEGTNSGITVDGITIDGAKYSGTLTVSNPSAGGGSGDLSAAWSSLGDAKDHIAARVWSADNDGIKPAESALSGLNLTATAATLGAKPFGEGYVILPPQDAVPFTVTYTIHNGFASDGTTKLNKQVQYQFTPDGSWDMAKKNVYSLDFNLTEILVNPSIVDWDDVEAEVVPIPDPANGHAYVDLGLRSGGNKILFATMNIGASAPEEFGDFFAWGETSKRYSGEFSYLYFNEDNAPFWDGSAWTKYNETDGKITLDAADDVASVLWGGNWRMPDRDDFEFLDNSDYCTWEEANDYNSTGADGLIFTGKGEFAGNSIFIPSMAPLSNHTYTDYWTRTRRNISDPSSEIRRAISYGFDYECDWYEAYSVRQGAGGVRPVLVLPL